MAKTYDYLDRSRAVEVFLDCIPAMSMSTLRDGQAEAGADASNKVCIFDTLMDSTTVLLTGNTSTMYAIGFLDLAKDGPTVVDLPTGMLGILDDMAFLYQTDLGVAGPDQGEGGKYLFCLPATTGTCRTATSWCVRTPTVCGCLCADTWTTGSRPLRTTSATT